MERRTEGRESACTGTMNHSGEEHAIEFQSASNQFYTRSCARCAGLLVRDWCYDLVNAGEHNAEVYRCVQCGHRVDPVILQNQARPPAKSASAGRTHRSCSAGTAILGEAA
jgi:hypothetical protein